MTFKTKSRAFDFNGHSIKVKCATFHFKNGFSGFTGNCNQNIGKIMGWSAALSNLKQSIPNLTSSRPRNTSDIPRNLSEIVRNTSDIPGNSLEIVKNTSDIPRNTSEIARNLSEIVKNASEIPGNLSEIAGNFLFKLEIPYTKVPKTKKPRRNTRLFLLHRLMNR